jgi:hypothetical protein
MILFIAQVIQNTNTACGKIKSFVMLQQVVRIVATRL